MRPRCATSRSAPGRAVATGRPSASPSDIARRPRRPRTARSRAMRPRAVVIKRSRLRLRHRRIERIRRTMRTARSIVRPLRRIRTAASGRLRAVSAQIFIPVLFALFISRHGATKTIAPARAERDAIRRQYQIGLVLSRRRRRHKRIARHPQRPRIRRIERCAFHGRSVLHLAATHTRRMPLIPSSSPALRPKHIGTGRPINQRIAPRGISGGNRKRTRDRGGGRKAEGVIHQRSEAGDMQ